MEPGGVVSASGSAARGRRRAPARVERGGGGAGAGAGGDAPARESHAQRRRRRRRRDPRGIGWGMDFPARLPIPDAVLRIAKQLEGAGYETWCVGGAIRDNLLKVENHDFDLTTAAPPDEVRRLFNRTVPVGIEHGTVAVLDQQNRQHEVTTFRKDIKTDGRHAVVEFGVSLMDDLARRDFTINAIAYHPIRHEWRDPFHGAEDLEHKLIRSVGDANWRFQEDYLRILRALRFSARFEFRIQPRPLEAAKSNVPGPETRSRSPPLAFPGLGTRRRPDGPAPRSPLPAPKGGGVHSGGEGPPHGQGSRGERRRSPGRRGAARARCGGDPRASARGSARRSQPQHARRSPVPCLPPSATPWSPRSATSSGRSRSPGARRASSR